MRDDGRMVTCGAVFARVEERRANLALGGKGTASGEGVCGGLLPTKMEGCADVARLGGEMGEGESGDRGDALGDLPNELRNLEGERDSERRMDLKPSLTSTLCACVGEGSVMVPPL